MTKLYKPVLYGAIIFLVVLLMHYSRVGVMHLAHVLSLGVLYAAGLVLGALTDLLEA